MKRYVPFIIVAVVGLVTVGGAAEQQAVTSSNFRMDVNAGNNIDSADGILTQRQNQSAYRN
jgi:hypothetical protein